LTDVQIGIARPDPHVVNIGRVGVTVEDPVEILRGGAIVSGGQVIGALIVKSARGILSPST
jgi:hypothetical protein